MGKNSQVRASSAVAVEPSGKGTVPAFPGKAGSTATLTQAGEQESSENSSEGETPVAVTVAWVRLPAYKALLSRSVLGALSLCIPYDWPLSFLCLCTQPCFGLSPLILCVIPGKILGESSPDQTCLRSHQGHPSEDRSCSHPGQDRKVQGKLGEQ